MRQEPLANGILCVRFTPVVHDHSSVLSNAPLSARGATRDMGGWLALTQPGLSPGKKRQASLGALTVHLWTGDSQASRGVGRRRGPDYPPALRVRWAYVSQKCMTSPPLRVPVISFGPDIRWRFKRITGRAIRRHPPAGQQARSARQDPFVGGLAAHARQLVIPIAGDPVPPEPQYWVQVLPQAAGPLRRQARLGACRKRLRRGSHQPTGSPIMFGSVRTS